MRRRECLGVVSLAMSPPLREFAMRGGHVTGQGECSFMQLGPTHFLVGVSTIMSTVAIRAGTRGIDIALHTLVSHLRSILSQLS